MRGERGRDGAPLRGTRLRGGAPRGDPPAIGPILDEADKRHGNQVQDVMSLTPSSMTAWKSRNHASIFLCLQEFHVCRKEHHHFGHGRESAPQDDRAFGLPPSFRVEVLVAETQRPDGSKLLTGQRLSAVFGPRKISTPILIS